MSRAVGKPVRVQWMRADEHVWEPKGPQQLMMVRAAIDDQGRPPRGISKDARSRGPKRREHRN